MRLYSMILYSMIQKYQKCYRQILTMHCRLRK